MPSQQSAAAPETFTIRNPINLRRSSLQLIRKGGMCCVAFSIDSEVEASNVQTHLFAKENPDTPASFDAAISSSTTSLPAGLQQTFEQEERDGICTWDELQSFRHDPKDTETYPLVVVVSADDSAASQQAGMAHTQVTFAKFCVQDSGEKIEVQTIKQHILVGESVYEMQEIYGVDSDLAWESRPEDGQECVICMESRRDTAVLPCRHLCMCGDCATTFRLRTNQCPVCRQRVTALLQIQP